MKTMNCIAFGRRSSGAGPPASFPGSPPCCATELKTNLSKYLLLSATEDIYITRNGKVISNLTNPFQERVDIAKSLFGILPNDVSLEEAKEERLKQI